MDLVDIDKVLDDLELDESKVLSKSTTKVSENKINLEHSENISRITSDETSNLKDESKSNICPKELTVDASLNETQHNINLKTTEYNTETVKTYPVEGSFSWNTNVSMCKNFSSFDPSSFNERSNKNNGNSNRIVAVSQVFNSLDEYRRDVESLRVDINKIDAVSKNVNKTDILNQCDHIKDKNGTSENISYQSQNLQSEQNIDLMNETTSETIPNVKIKSDSQSNLKCPNEHLLTKMIEDDDSVDGFTSTSSITTSSPSSFSSGPSPRSPPSADCVADDDLNELAGYETDDLSIQSNNVTHEKIEKNVQKQYSTSKNNATAVITNETKSQSISKIADDDENLEDSNGPNSIDLVGLSSISSSFYIENSLSSIPPELSAEQHKKSKYKNLSNKINDESRNEISSVCEIKFKNEEISTDDEISSPTRSDLIKTCDISETPKDSICERNKKGVQLCLMEEKLEDKHLVQNNDEETKINQYLQKESPKLPITFGSTMDEISDTELDSMLQDIDNELQNNGINKEKMFENDENFEFKKLENFNCSEEMSNKLEDVIDQKRNCGSSILISVENNKRIEMETTGKSKMSQKQIGLNKENSQDCEINENTKINAKTIDDDFNMQNADSFSQASTIEFADLQSQNDLRIVGNENESIYSGGEIHNDKLGIVKITTSDGSDACFKKEQQYDEIKLSQEASCEEKNSQMTSIEANEKVGTENIDNIREQNLSRRPKVLNLPITNSTATVLAHDIPASDMEERTIDMLNLVGTAGQTPPASALTNLNPNLNNLSQDVSPSINNQSTIESDQNTIDISQDIQPQMVNNEVVENDVISTSKQQARNQNYQLGKVPPFWIPDSEASFCMQCKVKFSLIKRRHHCRACGHVLCSLCCSQKAKLEFLGNDNEVRVCVQCHLIINNMENNTDNIDTQLNDSELGAVGGVIPSSHTNNSTTNNFIGVRMNSNNFVTRSPNPNNPMEYCSTIPPHEQVKKNQTSSKPISVMVPVGVLKREGALSKNRKDKNVIFSDGIRPGCDLADLDNSWLDKSGISNSSQYNSSRKSNFDKEYIPPVNPRILRKSLPICDENNSYIPKENNALPPIYEKVAKSNEYNYKEIQNNNHLIERLQKECLKFAVQRNFYVYVKIVKLTCCVNKTVINFTTRGMHHVGQDEIIILLEYDNSNLIPKDIFIHLNEIYRDADKGHPITELGYSIAKQQHFLGGESKITTNGGFLYIRATFQCLQEINLPDPPFLIGVLIHRWEIPWAKVFPLRLMLRLGAQYRYYPSPHLSIRGRSSVYAEIAQTIINFLADFRNYSYTIPIIKGMIIHMEDRKTSVLVPRNRHDQIVKALNNSSDHILALCGNFSRSADGHLVCIQNLESDCPDTHTYSTQAINIQGQPRRVTGASFIVLNGALKTNSGLSGKCSIIEDGLMVHILSQKMQLIRKNLKNMKDIDIKCGPIDADESQTEMVSIQWVDDDAEFNIGVKSPIDDKKLDGISSIRVHSGLNYSNSNFIIRWTEVFLIQSKRESIHGKIAIDISKISEQIARSTSTALVPLLDLLAASECYKIALRVTLHQDNVCYEAGSKNFKLAPLYMNALDNELVPILHKQATMYEINNPIILELIFHILHK